MIQVLICSRDEEKKEKIRRICRNLGVSFLIARNSDAEKTIMQLMEAGLSYGGGMSTPTEMLASLFPASPAQIHQPVPAFYQLPELVLVGGMQETDRDDFLDRLKSVGIGKETLKAVLTPTNMQWSLYELCDQLQKEHQFYHK